MATSADERWHAELAANLGWVRRLARAILRDDAAADDLAQDVVRVALERREPIRGEARGLRAWLRGVARKLALDRVRSEAARRRRERAVAPRESLDDPSEVVERGWRQQRVARAVLELAEPYRTTVLLRYLDELPTAEVARRTSVGEATARQRLSRGLALLRERLDRELGADSRAWALALLAPAREPLATSVAVPGLWKGATLVSAKWIASAAAAAVAVVGIALWRATSTAEGPAALGVRAGAPELASPAASGAAPETAPVAERRAAAGPPAQLQRVAAAAVEPATLLRVRVVDERGVPIDRGEIDCCYAREPRAEDSPSARHVRVGIASEVTEIRLPADAVEAGVRASVAGARGSATTTVAPLRPPDAADGGEVVHDVRVELDAAPGAPALAGAILVDGVRRAPVGLRIRCSGRSVGGAEPRVNTLDASYVLDEGASADARLWVTSDETAPCNFELDAGIVARGTLDLELETGRTLALTLLDRASGMPLADTTFHVRRDVRLRANLWDSDQRTLRSDAEGRCEVAGLQAGAIVTLLPDSGPRPRAMIVNGSAPWRTTWLNVPWWTRRLAAGDPQRIELALRVTPVRDGASAFGYVPPGLRGGSEREERVSVVAREINLAFDADAPGAERLEARGDAFELPVDAEGRWTLAAAYPSRFAVWLERSASRARLSEEAEVALDEAREEGPIELRITGGLPVELRLARVPERGRVTVTIQEPDAPPRREQIDCPGGACSHAIQLARAADVTVAWASDEHGESSISRSARIDPARESERTFDFGDARSRSVELAPVGLALEGEVVLVLRRLDAPGGEVVQVPLSGGRSGEDAPIGAGRWMYGYVDWERSVLILGVVGVDASSPAVRLTPEIVARPRTELGARIALREVDGVPLAAAGAAPQAIPVPGGDGPVWISAGLRYDVVP